jgi:hypothetical protein
MENRKVWVFYAVVASLWVLGFGTALMRQGAASRHVQGGGAVAAGAASPGASRFATHN